MCTQLFDPKVDYVFKHIFGSEKHPRILISFLNAYTKLPRTICINVLDFILLNEEKFHNKYLIQNAVNSNVLTDTLELHFIEIPKMKSIDESDLLSIWVGFLDNPNSETENYRMRENARNDRLNALLSDEIISEKTGLSSEEIKSL